VPLSQFTNVVTESYSCVKGKAGTQEHATLGIETVAAPPCLPQFERSHQSDAMPPLLYKPVSV